MQEDVQTAVDEKAAEEVMLPPAGDLRVDDTEQFVITPAQQGRAVRGRITRDKKGVDRGIFPTYFLHLELDDGKRVGGCCLSPSLAV